MKAILILFDSLNRRMLSPYGAEDVHTPGFDELAKRTVQFENCYVGSLPCMPARRELHTGRCNFLHRAWGPLEPFDDSMPEMLKQNGVYSHLITDHYHYWQDGGATYHNRYASAEFVRGQEVDEWKALMGSPEMPENYDASMAGWRGELDKRDFLNRSYMDREEKMCTPQVFSLADEFLDKHHDCDNWFLQVEAFDPHEPYFSSEEFQKLYPEEYDGPHFDWPYYRPVEENADTAEHIRNRAKALFSMCDAYLKRFLDKMDQYSLWEDTMLIVGTDHGFLLGEHDWWGKNLPPCYNEIAHTPLFIWDPRAKVKEEKREALVSTIDIAPTVLDYFHIDPTPDMEGRNLAETIRSDQKVHDAVMFGYFGKEINVTDGRYVYMKAGRPDADVHEYTLMPCYMNSRMSTELLSRSKTVKDGFPFTKDYPLLKIPSKAQVREESLLFDIKRDPKQERPIEDTVEMKRLDGLLKELMVKNQAPREQLERFGFE